MLCATCSATPIGTFHDGSPRFGCGPHAPIFGDKPTPLPKRLSVRGKLVTFRKCLHCFAVAPAGHFEWVRGGSWGEYPVRSCPYCGALGRTGIDFVRAG
jgi:hypothetical protein